MILKITPKQSAKVRKLARRECCNCVDSYCLLLDDGEKCKCVQLISRYGIYCYYFRKAVLPAAKGYEYMAELQLKADDAK